MLAEAGGFILICEMLFKSKNRRIGGYDPTNTSILVVATLSVTLIDKERLNDLSIIYRILHSITESIKTEFK